MRLTVDRNRRLAELTVERGWLEPARAEAALKLCRVWGVGLTRCALDANWISPDQAQALERLAGGAARETAAVSPEVSTPPPRPVGQTRGARVGDYVLERQLGAGAMGTVYAARHAHSDLRHAVKIARFPSGPKQTRKTERFLREGRTLARVRHPGVVRVHQCELLADQVGMLAMDLVEGQDLASLLFTEGLHDPQAAKALCALVADALAALHAVGVVHRDVKPANVIVRPDGTPVLCDFGLVHDQTASRLTESQQLVGTPLYMAPELILGEREKTGPPADVYSLGVVLYEALAGAHPFEGRGSLLSLATEICSGRAAPLRRLRPELPKPLAELVGLAMALEPSERPTATELAAALRDPAWRPPSARSKLGLAGAGVAALLAAWLLAIGLPAATRSAPPPDTARPVAPEALALDAVDAALRAKNLPAAQAALVRAETLARRADPAGWRRRAALISALTGSPKGGTVPEWTDLDRRWLALEVQRQTLESALGRIFSFRESPLEPLAAAADLAALEPGYPPHPLIGDLVRERVTRTLLDTILDVKPSAYTAETRTSVDALAAHIAHRLPPGDPRAAWSLLVLEQCRRLQGHPTDASLNPQELLESPWPSWRALGWAASIVGHPKRPAPETSALAAALDLPATRPQGVWTRGPIYLLREAHAAVIEASRAEALRRASAGEPQLARAHWERALGHARINAELADWKKKPRPAYAQWGILAGVYLLGGSGQEAKQVVSELPGPEGEQLRALVYAEAAILDGALPLASASIQVLPTSASHIFGQIQPDVLTLRAFLAAKAGDSAQAERLFAKAKQLRRACFFSWRTVAATRAQLAGEDVRRPLWDALAQTR